MTIQTIVQEITYPQSGVIGFSTVFVDDQAGFKQFVAVRVSGFTTNNVLDMCYAALRSARDGLTAGVEKVVGQIPLNVPIDIDVPPTTPPPPSDDEKARMAFQAASLAMQIGQRQLAFTLIDQATYDGLVKEAQLLFKPEYIGVVL